MIQSPTSKRDLSLDHDYLLSVLHYNPKTGVFSHLKKTQGRQAGPIKYTPSSPRPNITIAGKLYRVHRLAWFYMNKEFPGYGYEVYPIDGNYHNTKYKNLRSETISEHRHRGQLYSTSTSGHRGVYYSTRRDHWIAQISVRHVRHGSPPLQTIEEAIKYRKWLERKYL